MGSTAEIMPIHVTPSYVARQQRHEESHDTYVEAVDNAVDKIETFDLHPNRSARERFFSAEMKARQAAETEQDVRDSMWAAEDRRIAEGFAKREAERKAMKEAMNAPLTLAPSTTMSFRDAMRPRVPTTELEDDAEMRALKAALAQSEAALALERAEYHADDIEDAELEERMIRNNEELAQQGRLEYAAEQAARKARKEKAMQPLTPALEKDIKNVQEKFTEPPKKQTWGQWLRGEPAS